jgi:hypothetical protein
MNDRIVLVTPPDDVHYNGLRILLVDLAVEHTQFISDVLTKTENVPTIISYVWNTGDDVVWLLDKKDKSDLIVFNADSHNQTIVGFLSAYSNSHYFGTLKDLHVVNNSAIYSVEQFVEIFNYTVKKYESKTI